MAKTAARTNQDWFDVRKKPIPDDIPFIAVLEYKRNGLLVQERIVLLVNDAGELETEGGDAPAWGDDTESLITHWTPAPDLPEVTHG